MGGLRFFAGLPARHAVFLVGCAKATFSCYKTFIFTISLPEATSPERIGGLILFSCSSQTCLRKLDTLLKTNARFSSRSYIVGSSVDHLNRLFQCIGTLSFFLFAVGGTCSQNNMRSFLLCNETNPIPYPRASLPGSQARRQ